MPRLGDLQLKNEPLQQEQMASLDDMQESGSFLPMLQPGSYEFQIPANVDDAFDLIDATGKKWGPESTGEQNLVVVFDDAHPLKIVGAPPHAAKRIGEPFRERVGSNPRKWKIGGVETQVRDMLYLLKKLGEKVIPTTPKAYGDAIVKYAGKTFKAPVGVSWGCNKNRKARFWQLKDANDPASGAAIESQQPGCGKRMYPDKDVKPGPDGLYPEQVQCPQCQAIVRGFSNLELTREA
jgi:hypothetical protein